jgi:hypothetical protein
VLSLAHGPPYPPEGQILGIDVTERAVLALFLDEQLQLHHVDIPLWLDDEWRRFACNEAYKSRRSIIGHRGLL